MSEDLPTIRRLLQESSAALEARNSKLAAGKLEALLALTHAATSPEGVHAFLEGLIWSITLCLVLRDPEQAARFLGELEHRMGRYAGPNRLRDTYREAVVRARRDIEALRRGGHGRTDAISLFFELHSDKLPVGQRAAGQTPQAGGHILREAAERAGNDAHMILPGMVAQIVVGIVDQTFRGRDWGRLIAWLDQVEPYLTQCDPESAMKLISGWASAYRTVALHGHSTRTFEDVLDRTEALFARVPPPIAGDPASWAKFKDRGRRLTRLFADLDHALVLGTWSDARQAARRMLESEFAAELRPEQRQMFERIAAGRPRFSRKAPPVWEQGHSRYLLLKVLERLKSGRWKEACDILAPLAAAEPERDGDLAAGVPLALANCIAVAAPTGDGPVLASIALLKEAVRQTERQRLEAADQARGALDIMGSSILTAPYLQLQQLLLKRGRIGEAVRVEMLLAERDHRLPVAPDRALLEQSAERLPCFPGESEFWARTKTAAGSVVPRRLGDWLRRRPPGTVTGAEWLTQLLHAPPQLNLADGRSPAPLPICAVQEDEIHIALTQSGRQIAAALRMFGGREELVWIPVDPARFHETVKDLHAAIRQESPLVQEQADLLSDILVRPLAPFLETVALRRLLIEPAGAIGHVPFPVLCLGNTCLAQRFEIVLQGGWPVSPEKEGEGVVSIGAAGHDNALTWVSKDLDLLASFAERTGMHVDTFGKDLAARKEPILRRLASPCRILHISSHFDAQLLDMAASAFQLDEGDRLTVEELSRCAFAGCDLVLLLGCETASRPPASPDSPIVGVDAALLRLGVRSVVASQWPVDDLASHLFLRTFLDAIAVPGTTKAAAVRQAQLSLMMSEDRRLRHAMHWAAFTLAGQG